MKKAILLLIVVAFIFACNKSSNDDPEPTPSENYKITYHFTAIGLDTLEYIRYLNSSGEEITVSNTNNFDLSFEQPSNNTHAKITIKGETGTMITTYASFSLKVTDKNDNIIYFNDGEKEGPQTSFLFEAEYKNKEN